MFELSGYMMEILFNGSSRVPVYEGRMRLRDVRMLSTIRLDQDIGRERSRQAMNVLVNRGFVDFIRISGGKVGKDFRWGTKWFGLTPTGVSRMGVSNGITKGSNLNDAGRCSKEP